jgi:hypothetical protein
MVIQLLNLGLGSFVSLVGSLLLRFMGENPFDFWVGKFAGRFGQLHHVGFDSCGGDVEVLEVEEDFQWRRKKFGEKKKEEFDLFNFLLME